MQDFKNEIRELIKNKDFNGIRNQNWEEWQLADLADLLLGLENPNRAILFRLMPRNISANVFAYFDKEHKNSLLKDLTDEETRHLLANLRPDDRTSLFEEMPGQITQRLLNLLSHEDLKETRFLLGYPEESVGRLMTPEYVAVRPNWTAEQALEHIRIKGKDKETLNVIYVIDDNWKLIDGLEIHKFILANPNDKVEDIMNRSYFDLSAFDDREKAVWMMQRYDLFALPVVDSDGVLIGAVTFDDVFDVAQEEATEDFHKGAAVAPLKTSYREATVWELFRKRVGWLVVLVFVMLVASEVIASFEEVLASVIALAFFIPLLIDVGGNTGAQSATLMVRAIATDDIKTKEWAGPFMKEISVGAALGITMGLIVYAFGLWRGGIEIAMIVGLSMIAIVIVANLMGVILPFILSKFNADPAVASSPLITSIVDITGLLIYFGIAASILGF
ncbi:Mg/Co/Ni transporter MgtE, CBS domain-containing [Candidatus Syntrophocurvum alkaliphilum]|uniref:Magnesium transporter MgtE n=1 Tax=Candidatus Syntrophocurvum alkaliphilum TaxID=2293317 RepID=A0A6I6DB65_9FIRM|nr:magnesium transporter [Candidatus Syntrophocurvum alkaliphilum]QGT98734.1 Mg/Co/Ni transporter MgtE, CBS domain-containing [Candidatus Syntrophocurvum alkaliphilum]